MYSTLSKGGFLFSKRVYNLSKRPETVTVTNYIFTTSFYIII